MFGFGHRLQTSVLGSGFVGPLDDYTANLAGAWSVARRLLTSYTGSLIRIRRSSDDVEQDIGYASNGGLNTTAITAFVGANSAYVTTVYDQLGTNDFTQATAATQPRIVDSGSLDTLGGEPAFYSVSDRVVGSALSGAAMTLYGVFQSSADPAGAGAGAGALLSAFGSGADQDHFPFTDGNVYYGAGSNSRKSCGNPTPSLADPVLMTCVSASGNWILRLNSAAFYSTASNTVGFGTAPSVGGGPVWPGEGWVKEWVWYQAAHGSTEWANIEPILTP